MPRARRTSDLVRMLHQESAQSERIAQLSRTPANTSGVRETRRRQPRVVMFPKGPYGDLLRVKRHLDRLAIGHGEQGGYNLCIGEPTVVSLKDRVTLRTKGRAFTDMLDITNRLYAASLEKPSVVTYLAESGLDERAMRVQRELHELYERVPLPLFFRADMLDLDTAVELNIPGGGLGLMHALQEACKEGKQLGRGMVQGWAHGLKTFTGKESPTVYLPIHNPEVERHVKYFVAQLRKAGINAKTYRWNSRLPDPDLCDVVVRMGMNHMVKKKDWGILWNAYKEGSVHIEPAPTGLYNSKVAEVLLFHPSTRENYPERIRAAFPQTWLVEEGLEIPTTVGGKPTTVTIEDLPYLSQGGRRFVLKYAGADNKRSCAGKAVYQLDCSKAGAEELVLMALEGASRGEIWLLQPRLRVKHDVRVLDEDQRAIVERRMQARIMPYFCTATSTTQLIGGTALYSGSWKVHGNTNSVHCAINVR